MDFEHGLAQQYLDRYPSRLAIIDEGAELLWSNIAWRESEDTGTDTSDILIGDNLLDILERDPNNPHLAVIREELESVLSGEKYSFIFDYPDHGLEVFSWSRLEVTAVDVNKKKFTLISKQKIAEEKIAQLQSKAQREMANALNIIIQHNIRNAVTAGHGWLGQMEAGDEDPFADDLAAARRSFDRISAVVERTNRILALMNREKAIKRVTFEEVFAKAQKVSSFEGEVVINRPESVLMCYPAQFVLLVRSVLDNAADCSVKEVHVDISEALFTVSDDREDSFPDLTDKEALTAPDVSLRNALSLDLLFICPIVLLHGWALSSSGDEENGWRFTIRTDQKHPDRTSELHARKAAQD